VNEESQFGINGGGRIKERFQAATSSDEIKSLLRELEGFNHASARTIRRCRNIATAKLRGFKEAKP
jgi:hypothetical protein